ncbi:MAG: bifunctional [glutamate--ammonia ligase]-adenylyl-L-tyrosine phosphorylase/[glutamate--ammonia-ligase] adenylyltransferase [Thiolinea sp.]
MPDKELQTQALTSEFFSQLNAVKGFSPYIQTQLELHPEWSDRLYGSQAYETGQLKQAIRTEILSIHTEDELLSTIRQIRHRETVRIAWRDLAAIASLNETMRDVSDLADALVDGVLSWWHKQLSIRFGKPLSRTGTPQNLLVLGLGKLGGCELNFSSDIDLIFAFPEAGSTDGQRSLDNQTYFTRLGQKLINSLGKVTADGFAYRVDMRLRPFGESGALALSFDAMEHYYQAHGREWERYALIKARVITGNKEKGKELLYRLRPFIYRRYLDYGAVEQLRDMKRMINQEAQRKGKKQDIKLGKGGIREIEFTAQVFQLMRGGRLKELQQTHLLKTLSALQNEALLSLNDYQQLHDAYIFLRNTENRLQMWNDEQVHSLPTSPNHQHQLALAMHTPGWDSFISQLDQHRIKVSHIFQRIFALEEDATTENKMLADLWQGSIFETTTAVAMLEEQGFELAHTALSQLKNFRESRRYQSLTELARARLDRLIPVLLSTCAQRDEPTLALERSLQVIQAIASRSGYIAMLADQPAATDQFVKLVHASSWITTQLTQHPILLDNLLDTRQLYRPLDRNELRSALQQEMSNVDPNDTELVMERLRQFKLAQTLRVAAADITDMLPLMVVSDQLSWIAEVILDYTVQHAWHLLTSKAGVPCYELDDRQYQADFGIVAYGKLGGLELGYSSDLDIVFIHNSTGIKQRTNGEKQMDNAVFFARLAQKVIHILSTYTHDGRLYEIDTRLRPSGQSGLLVTGIAALQQYQLEKAWVWEHQALLRSRIITGTQNLRESYDAMRTKVLCQSRDNDLLRTEVIAMRQKMWQSQSGNDPLLFNLKKDHGGITDLEFIVQYLILSNANQSPELVHWSDNIRQLESLRQHGILSKPQEEKLAAAYRTLRNKVHALALQEKKAFVSKQLFQTEQNLIRQCWVDLVG